MRKDPIVTRYDYMGYNIEIVHRGASYRGEYSEIARDEVRPIYATNWKRSPHAAGEAAEDEILELKNREAENA